MRLRTLLPLVAAVATAAPAGAAPLVMRPMSYAVFHGNLKATAGTYESDLCYEVDTSGRAGLRCEFSFRIVQGSLTCEAAGDPRTEARAAYRSELLGVTFSDVPLYGLTLQGSPHLRGTLVGRVGSGTPTLLNIDVNVASLCDGERRKTFHGVVTYL